MKKIEFTQEEKDEFIRLYQEGYGYRKIAAITCNPHAQVIGNFLRQQGFHRAFSTLGKHTQHKIIHEDYFDKIDNEHKAYWLGFLYADGSVYKTTLKIHLKKDESNIQLLKQFIKDIGADIEITEGTQNSFGTTTEFCQVVVYSSLMVKQLNDKGCVFHKSAILQFPTAEQVPHEFILDFIRGYFDGDGSFLQGRTKSGKAYISASFIGTKEFLTGIKNELDITSNIFQDKRHFDKNIYYLSFGRTDQVKKIMQPLYQNATIYLERKYNIFTQYTL